LPLPSDFPEAASVVVTGLVAVRSSTVACVSLVLLHPERANTSRMGQIILFIVLSS
jgi:hypothetical protein